MPLARDLDHSERTPGVVRRSRCPDPPSQSDNSYAFGQDEQQLQHPPARFPSYRPVPECGQTEHRLGCGGVHRVVRRRVHGLEHRLALPRGENRVRGAIVVWRHLRLLRDQPIPQVPVSVVGERREHGERQQAQHNGYTDQSTHRHGRPSQIHEQACTAHEVDGDERDPPPGTSLGDASRHHEGEHQHGSDPQRYPPTTHERAHTVTHSPPRASTRTASATVRRM